MDFTAVSTVIHGKLYHGFQRGFPHDLLTEDAAVSTASPLQEKERGGGGRNLRLGMVEQGGATRRWMFLLSQGVAP